MKKLNILVVLMTFVSVSLFTGCSKDDDKTELTVPQIEVKQITTGDVVVGNPITYEVKINSGTDLKTFVLYDGSYEGGKIISTVPENVWNENTNLFVEGTKTVTITYEMGTSADIANEKYTNHFIITDITGDTYNSPEFEYTLKAL